MGVLYFVLVFAGWCSVVYAAQQTNVCSQVHLMSQYCASQQQGGNETDGGVATFKAIEARMAVKFTEMEARLVRTLGAPPPVNYTAVEETIAAKFKGVEARVIQQLGEPPVVNYTAIDVQIQERFRSLEARVNGDGEIGQGIVNYGIIQEKINVKFTELRSYIDSKFALIVNDTEEYQKALEEMRRRKNISDCTEVRLEDAKLCNATGGLYDIYRGVKKYEVFCDTLTDGGGWTVFQRRMDGSVDFNRTWQDYVTGFGSKTGEFWLGLKNIHELMQGGTHELRIDFMDAAGSVRFAKYGIFYITGKSRNYNLMIQSFSGDIANSLSYSSGRSFSTLDKDLDTHSSHNCAKNQQGGWWFTNCGYTNLNGRNIYWNGMANLVKTEMKFRRLLEDPE